METFSIESSSAQNRPTSPTKQLSSPKEKYVKFILCTVALGYISIGYHLSIFNSISVFLWQGVQREYEYYSFQNTSDMILAFGTAFVIALICLNKVKFKHYMRILIFADVLMIIGTFCSFSVLAPDSYFIFIGRFICAESIGINIACIPSFLREVQYKISDSSFKPEKRKFFIEVFLALGAFFGLTPTQLISSLAPLQEYHEEFTGTQGTYIRPDIMTCLLISIIPVTASIVRICSLLYIGDVQIPTYSPIFTDEGLLESEEDDNENGTSYMFKFRGAESITALFQYPFRRRIELCYLLFFLQVSLGYGLFLVNPMKVALYLKSVQHDSISDDVQFVSLEYGAVYLVITVITSFVFAVYKIPRRLVMYIGVGIGLLTSFTLLFTMMLLSFTYTRTLLLIFWASTCISFGPVMEIYAEEMLPNKGLQLMHATKWMLIGVIGLVFRSLLTVTLYFIALYLFYLIVGVLAIFVVHELVIETVNLSKNELNDILAAKESENLPDDKSDFVLGNTTEKDSQYEPSTKLEFFNEDFTYEHKSYEDIPDEIE